VDWLFLVHERSIPQVKTLAVGNDEYT